MDEKFASFECYTHHMGREHQSSEKHENRPWQFAVNSIATLKLLLQGSSSTDTESQSFWKKINQQDDEYWKMINAADRAFWDWMSHL